MYSQTMSRGCLTVTDALDSGMTEPFVCERLWVGRAGATPHTVSGRVVHGPNEMHPPVRVLPVGREGYVRIVPDSYV